MILRAVSARVLCTAVLLLSAATTADAVEGRVVDAGEPESNSSVFGKPVAEPFDAPEGRELPELQGRVLYEEVRNVDSRLMMDALIGAGDSGDVFNLALAKGEPLGLEIVPADKVALEQTGIVVMRSVVTGEVSISSSQFSEFHAAFADSRNRGRWILDTTERGELRIRLIEFTISYEHDDPRGVLSDDRRIIDDDEEPGEFEFDESYDVPSSFPDETWLLPDGSRAFSDEELAEFNQRRIQRNRVRSGSIDVIDVAVLSGGYTNTWSTISTLAKQMINQANAVMINSSQPTRFRLVAAVAETPGLDAPPGSTATSVRNEIRGDNATDSALRLAVIDARSRYQADVVAIVAPNNTFAPGVTGVAGHTAGGQTGNPTGDYTFFVLERNEIQNGESVAHEFGHLLGAGHSVLPNGTRSDARPYANAHTFSVFGIPGYTIMASQPGNRQVRFSTPNQRLNGNSGPYLGIAGNTTNARDNLRAVASYDDNVADLRRGNHCPSHGTGHSLWVAEMYHRLVGTNINPAQTAFQNRLTNGQFNGSVYSTAEAVQNLGADNGNSYRSQELTRVFRTLFGRVPDYGGYDFWLDRRWNGYSIATVISNFFASPEYSNLHGNKTDHEFMTYLYQNGLGRSPDSGGLNWWLGEIDDHGRQDVVRRFSQSQEAINHQKTMTSVAQLYLGVLEKTPNANGFPTFVNRIDNQGWTPADVAREFMTYGNYWTSC